MLTSAERNEVKAFNWKSSKAPKLIKVTVDFPILSRRKEFP